MCVCVRACVRACVRISYALMQRFVRYTIFLTENTGWTTHTNLNVFIAYCPFVIYDVYLLAKTGVCVWGGGVSVCVCVCGGGG